MEGLGAGRKPEPCEAETNRGLIKPAQWGARNRRLEETTR